MASCALLATCVDPFYNYTTHSVGTANTLRHLDHASTVLTVATATHRPHRMNRPPPHCRSQRHASRLWASLRRRCPRAAAPWRAPCRRRDLQDHHRTATLRRPPQRPEPGRWVWLTGLRVPSQDEHLFQEEGSTSLPPKTRMQGIPEAHLALVQPARSWVDAHHVTAGRVTDQCFGLGEEHVETSIADHTH